MNFAEPLKTIADNVPKVYQAGYDDGVAAGGGGANPSEIVENLPIVLDFSDGDQEIVAPDGVLVKSAIIQKPETLNPENIAEGVNIAGIVGTLAAGGGTSDELCYVTFMSYDGSVEYGKKAVAVGDDCADPIARGIFETPTRESDAQYNYTFYGWATEVNGAADSKWNKSITEDKTVYANFASAVRYYTITYYDADGTTVLKTESLAYGSVPAYAPTKDEYDFVAWTPEPVEVTGETSYTATWKEKAAFATASWEDIIAVAQNGNASSTFAVGDERTEEITYADGTTESITWVIASLNGTCTITDGTKDNITIIAKHALATKRQIAKAMSTNYETSTLATFLNGDFYNALPEVLRNAIKDVYTKNEFYASQKCWIPSLRDLGTSRTDYAPGSSTGPFELFISNDSRQRKLGANGELTGYWTRSPRNSGAYSYFAYIKTDGVVNNDSKLPNEKFAVVPCFCI